MKPFFTAPVWTGAAAVGATHGGAVRGGAAVGRSYLHSLLAYCEIITCDERCDAAQ